MHLYRLRLHGKGNSWEGGDAMLAMVYDHCTQLLSLASSLASSPFAVQAIGRGERVTDDEVSGIFLAGGLRKQADVRPGPTPS